MKVNNILSQGITGTTVTFNLQELMVIADLLETHYCTMNHGDHLLKHEKRDLNLEYMEKATAILSKIVGGQDPVIGLQAASMMLFGDVVTDDDIDDKPKASDKITRRGGSM